MALFDGEEAPFCRPERHRASAGLLRGRRAAHPGPTVCKPLSDRHLSTFGVQNRQTSQAQQETPS